MITITVLSGKRYYVACGVVYRTFREAQEAVVGSR